MSQAAVIPQHWTEDELQRLPHDQFDYELVAGELVMSPKNNFFHGSICTQLSALLVAHVRKAKLGVILDSSTGFWMRSGNCRAPDISFVTRKRLQDAGFTAQSKKFFPGAPDLAVEILSPSNSASEMNSRLEDYFESGAVRVWSIDPEKQTASIHAGTNQSRKVPRDGVLQDDLLLPGFELRLGDLFQPWD